MANVQHSANELNKIWTHTDCSPQIKDTQKS